MGNSGVVPSPLICAILTYLNDGTLLSHGSLESEWIAPLLDADVVIFKAEKYTGCVLLLCLFQTFLLSQHIHTFRR